MINQYGFIIFQIFYYFQGHVDFTLNTSYNLLISPILNKPCSFVPGALNVAQVIPGSSNRHADGKSVVAFYQGDPDTLIIVQTQTRHTDGCGTLVPSQPRQRRNRPSKYDLETGK